MDGTLSIEKLLDICHDLTEALDGFELGRYRLKNASVSRDDRELDRELKKFFLQIFEQELVDRHIEHSPTTRDHLHYQAEIHPNDPPAVIANTYAKLSGFAAILLDAHPADHSTTQLRQEFIATLQDRLDIGEHAATEICNRLQTTLIETIDGNLGQIRGR